MKLLADMNSNESQPSVDMIGKIADAFGVTVDFLIGKSDSASFDRETTQRISDIQKMDTDTKNILFNVIDTYIQNFKTKKAFTK